VPRKNPGAPDILIKFRECLDVSYEILPHITDDSVAYKFQNSRLRDGDVIIADTAEDEAVGKCTEIINLVNEFVVSGLHTIALRPKRKFESRYLGFYMNSDSYRNQLHKLMQGVKVTSISKSALKATIVKFPSSIEEQGKIASLLSAIDKMIVTTNKKLEQMNAYKKGVIQKLFPAKGKSMPELRFKEFENKGEWEEKKLGDYLFEHKTKSDGKCQVYSVSVSKGVINQIEYLGRSFSASDTSNYKLVKTFDIIYTKSPTGNFPFGIVKQSHIEHNVIVSPLYGVFSPKNQYIGYIIHSFFESPERTNNYLSPIVQKGAKNTIQISNDVFLSGKVCFPSNEDEQRKIALFLSSINEMINYYINKIDLLQQHKTGLMQQLFPKNK
jgi:type I restriction enzyme S subunit